MQYDTEGARCSLGDLTSEEYAKYGSPRQKRQDCKPRPRAIRLEELHVQMQAMPGLLASRIAARFAQSALLLGQKGAECHLSLGLHSVRLKSRKVASSCRELGIS